MEKLYMITEPTERMSDAALEANFQYYIALSIEHQIKHMEYDDKAFLIEEELRLREMQRMNNGDQNEEA
jgi:flagellar motor switch protein FliM